MIKPRLTSGATTWCSAYRLCFVASTSCQAQFGLLVGGMGLPLIDVISLEPCTPPRGPTSTYCPETGVEDPGLMALGIYITSLCYAKAGMRAVCRILSGLLYPMVYTDKHD